MFIVLVLCLFLAACDAAGKETSCTHNYYLSDYSDSTTSSNGYKEFTCSNCERTYREVIPAIGEVSSFNNDDVNESVDLTRKKSANLFDLPVYSDEDVLSGAVKTLEYRSETTDVDGWKHTDCYEICGGKFERWVRYELNSKYTDMVGELYDANDWGGAGWLEFYDGEDFIAATPKIDENTPSVEFKIDITGVEYLTVHFCATEHGTWLIADDIMLSN